MALFETIETRSVLHTRQKKKSPDSSERLFVDCKGH